VGPANLGHARDFGIEAFANWQATAKWKISPGVSLLRMSVGQDPASKDTIFLTTPGDSPRQQFEVRSLLNLRRNLEWDSSLKYVAALGTFNVSAYARVDTRLGWHFGEKTELSVVGQNLATGPRFEFFDTSGLLTPSLVARTVFAKIIWRF
jgi:iron complex outermembrane receptor protein